jgi:hypothetical protein
MNKLFLRTLPLVLFIVAGATAIKAVVNNIKIRKPGGPPPCWSRADAMNKGAWVCDVQVDPSTFQSAGKIYRLGEAWIEEAFEDDYFLVWFPCRYKMGWNWLCLHVPNEDGIIEVSNFGTKYGHSQYVRKVQPGDFAMTECHVELWRGDGSGKTTSLGETTLSPMPGQ